MKIFKHPGIPDFIASLACQSSMTSSAYHSGFPLITPLPTLNSTDLATSNMQFNQSGHGGVTWPSISLVQVITGLSQPLHIAHAGDGSGRLFIVEKTGRIKVYENYVYQGVFLDISTKVSTSSEQGLLSVVFPPGYDTSGQFYVNYTNLAGDTVIARYQVSADPNQADAASEEILLSIDQPYANHNGGQMAFGPDGYLYIGMGDGGSGGDPGNRAQNPADLLGKLLRIDVDVTGTSAPPASGSHMVIHACSVQIRSNHIHTGFPQIIHSLTLPVTGLKSGHTGLRNPWRFSFDRNTGDLYIADVGQNEWEEVNFQSAHRSGGENYGWRILEGNHCYNPSSGCIAPSSYVAPVFEYAHGTNDGNGCSITGGFVYRGTDLTIHAGILLLWGFLHRQDLGGSAW